MLGERGILLSVLRRYQEAVALFEEGIKLARGLEKELAKVERKIEILVDESGAEDAEDQPNLELFPELDDGEE